MLDPNFGIEIPFLDQVDIHPKNVHKTQYSIDQSTTSHYLDITSNSFNFLMQLRLKLLITNVETQCNKLKKVSAPEIIN